MNTLHHLALVAFLVPVLGAPAAAQGCNMDPFEPNNTCVTATPMVSNYFCNVNATLQLGDDDWWSITLQPGESLTMGARADDPMAVIRITSYSTCSPLVLQEDEGNHPVVEVDNNGATPLTVHTRFRLIVGAPVNCADYIISGIRTAVTSCGPDQYEPNNCVNMFAPLTEGVHTGLNIEAGNPDWYSIEVPPGASIEVHRASLVPAGFEMDLIGNNAGPNSPHVVRGQNDTALPEVYWLEVQAPTMPAGACSPYALRVSINENFEHFCVGDGETTPGCTSCPCGNDAAGQLGGCLNGAGFSGVLLPGGNSSVGNPTMNFRLLSANPNTFAILVSGDFSAPNNTSNPCFGQGTGVTGTAFDGLRCVVGGFQRHGTRATDSNGTVGFSNNRWGPPNGPVGGLIQQGGFSAGQARHYQAIYREDPSLVCGNGQNTTQAIHVTILP